MLAAVAEMERDLLVERTQAGLARANGEGKTLGRPSKTTVEQRADIIVKYEQGERVSTRYRALTSSGWGSLRSISRHRANQGQPESWTIFQAVNIVGKSLQFCNNSAKPLQICYTIRK